MKLEIEPEKLFLTTPGQVERLTARSQEQIMNRIGKDTQWLIKAIKALLSKPRSRGATYKARSKKKVWHIASKPWFSPNPDTFNLRDSVEYVKEETGFLIRVEALNEAGFNYAPVLEFGTVNRAEKKKGGRSIVPRPYFYKTIADRLKSKRIKQTQLQILSKVENELEKEIT